MKNKLEPLVIGDLEIKIPIIQGAMGIQVSTSSLVGAVAESGGAGTIASVGLGFGSDENETNFIKASREGLEKEIRLSRKCTSGIVGVNIMVALNNFEDMVRTSVAEKADFIASGAGLPLKLPELTEGSSIKLIPIVSSARAAWVILKKWKKRYDRLPDAFIVEGPLAGGHLGFSFEELESANQLSLDKIVIETLEVVKQYEQQMNVRIPIIPAGGIFDGNDVARFFKLGAKGVQIASRFVATNECPASDSFKQLYISATAQDIEIIKSPVGMPGRVIKTDFIERTLRGDRIPVKCNYRCLKTCTPPNTPYCISQALYQAVTGRVENGVVFAGSNVSRINRIVSVRELMDEIVDQAACALTTSREPAPLQCTFR